MNRHHYDFAYFGAAEWGTDKFIDIDRLLDLENTPRAEWPVRNGNNLNAKDLFKNQNRDNRHKLVVNDDTWADWNLEW